MFSSVLVLAMICQPGLPHGIVPGMSREQVEARLTGETPCEFVHGQFGGSYTSVYLRRGLTVNYESGRVVNCHYHERK